jgi:hypothetical protein
MQLQVAEQAARGGEAGRRLRGAMLPVLAAVPRLGAPCPRWVGRRCVPSSGCLGWQPLQVSAPVHGVPLRADGGLNPAALGMLGMSLLESLQRAATALLSRAQHTTQQALRAIDWPAGQSGPDPGPSSPGAQPGTRVWQPAGPGWAGARDGSGSDAHAAAAAGKGLEPWRLLRFAAQEWLERVWQVRPPCSRQYSGTPGGCAPQAAAAAAGPLF